MPSEAALTNQLNTASRKIHRSSNSLVNLKLVALFSDRVLYAKALAQFYFVFSALEEALDEALKRGDADVEKFKEVFRGGLYRASGFRQNVEYILGADWQAQLPPKSQAVRDYELHLAALASSQPRLLLAHSFTQHLAAASGGQMIKKMARKHLQLPEDRGTEAFDFQGTSNTTLRARFKAILDELGSGWSEEEVQKMVDEHIAAFKHNNAIMRAFPIPLPAAVRGLIRITPQPVLLAVLGLLVLVVALILRAPWMVAVLRGARAAA